MSRTLPQPVRPERTGVEPRSSEPRIHRGLRPARDEQTDIPIPGIVLALTGIESAVIELERSWTALDERGRLAEIRRIRSRVRSLRDHAENLSEDTLAARAILASLTHREDEVLHALAGGASTSQAAAMLSVSVATVRSHVKSILSKTGVHSRIEAVALAHRAWGTE
jgi:DNA-binding CsgD family transcriptional regulator